MVECPDCGANVNIDDGADVGEIIVCQECGADLEIMDRDPIKLEVAPKEEEEYGE